MNIIFLVLYALAFWFPIFLWKEQEKGMAVVILLFSLGFIIPAHIAVVGFHYETGRGEHVGYITAVEKSGVFFKTGRAYVKTETESSQEDTYCVMDEAVLEQLKAAAQTKERKTIKYFSYLSAGIKNCGGEGDIIYALE